MLAMNYRGSYRVRAEQMTDPVTEHPGEAIVRVTRACICGSDLHLYHHGLVPDTRVGMIFGHEFTGIVEEVGPSVEILKVATRCWCRSTCFADPAFFASASCTATATTPIREPPRLAASMLLAHRRRLRWWPGAVRARADGRCRPDKSAWLMGAWRVIVVDHVEYRLEVVKRFAQCEVINFKEVDDMALHTCASTRSAARRRAARPKR
jgi:threonine dehydrogenase-like Zn-dependent dehydrogenase